MHAMAHTLSEDEALEEAFLGCNGVQGSNVELAQGV